VKKNEELSPKGAKIVAALAEFRDALKEGARIEDRFTVKTVELNLQPRALGPDDVKRVRELLNLSQPLFAKFLGVDVKTVRSWEQGLREPSPMACRFMSEIASAPKFWRERLSRVTTAKGHRMAEV
jgi:putative transcriptional regulator